eukprot:GEMP01022324.1.p1 GENE.GEMP01022324.1~~GEMP01022324.1.p1  ORF type:complete len:366 (+),score=79.15 GEMP01022324.1:137-1234(+)
MLLIALFALVIGAADTEAPQTSTQNTTQNTTQNVTQNPSQTNCDNPGGTVPSPDDSCNTCACDIDSMLGECTKEKCYPNPGPEAPHCALCTEKTTQEKRSCAERDLVCGTDGRTFRSQCDLEAEIAVLQRNLSDPLSEVTLTRAFEGPCTLGCKLTTDADIFTYVPAKWQGVDPRPTKSCNTCKCFNGGKLVCTDKICPQSNKCMCLTDFEPVCGDGLTYPNKCMAQCGGAEMITDGACSSSTTTEEPAVRASYDSLADSPHVSDLAEQSLGSPWIIYFVMYMLIGFLAMSLISCCMAWHEKSQKKRAEAAREADVGSFLDLEQPLDNSSSDLGQMRGGAVSSNINSELFTEARMSKRRSGEVAL